jgi:tetratricopeptide (TPR) repeat protein
MSSENENKCINCGNILQIGWKSCPFCGEAVEKKLVCTVCGKEIQSEWKVCPFCGASINSGQVASKIEQSGKEEKEFQANEYLKKGNDLFQKQLFDGAISAYNEAIQIYPNYADAYFNKGLCYKKKKDWDKALSEYSNAIKADPEFKEAYLQRINIIISDEYRQFCDDLFYQSHEDNDPGIFDNYNVQVNKAIDEATKYIELFPMDWQGYCARGNAYNELTGHEKDMEELAEDFSTAIRVAPDSPLPYFYRAKCYSRHYQYYDKALIDFNKALELDSNFKEAQKLLTELKSKIERSKKRKAQVG